MKKVWKFIFRKPKKSNFFTYKGTWIFITYIEPTRLWFSFVFSSWIVNEFYKYTYIHINIYIHTYIHTYTYKVLAASQGRHTGMRLVFCMWTNQVLFFTVYALKDLRNFWHYNKFILSNLHGKILIMNLSIFFNAMG